MGATEGSGKPRSTVAHLQLVGDPNKKIGRTFNPATGNIITKDTMINPPKRYTKETVEAWNLIVSNLIMMQSLTEADLPALKTLFDAYNDYVRARKAYLKHEIDLKAGTDELLKQTTIHQKLFGIMDSARDRFNKLAGRFGCTPTERSKLPINQDNKKDEDPLAVVLGN